MKVIDETYSLVRSSHNNKCAELYATVEALLLWQPFID